MISILEINSQGILKKVLLCFYNVTVCNNDYCNYLFNVSLPWQTIYWRLTPVSFMTMPPVHSALTDIKHTVRICRINELDLFFYILSFFSKDPTMNSSITFPVTSVSYSILYTYYTTILIFKGPQISSKQSLWFISARIPSLYISVIDS